MQKWKRGCKCKRHDEANEGKRKSETKVNVGMRYSLVQMEREGFWKKVWNENSGSGSPVGYARSDTPCEADTCETVC